MTQPAFHSTQIAGFVRIMEKHALAMMEQWQELAKGGAAFDVLPHLMRLTLNIVSEALFSTNLETDIAVIRDTLDVGREYTVDRAWSIVRVPQQLPTEEICNIDARWRTSTQFWTAWLRSEGNHPRMSTISSAC